MVLDRETYDLCPAAPAILPLLDRQANAWTATPETDASMLEVATSMLGSYREAAGQVEDIRHGVRQAASAVGVVVAGSGTHPFHRRRVRHVHAGQAASNPLTGFGMYVHVGVPGADEAVRICAWLSQRAPLFIALSASSPYWEGVDSGYCSARNSVAGVFQASGTMPPSLRSREDYTRHVTRLKQHSLAAGAREVDWDVRPDPAHGTVELRALDTPLHPLYAAALACYARELCIAMVERPGAWPSASTPELYQWNRFNATRRGVRGAWIDPCTRKKHPIEQIVRDDLARLVARSSDPDFMDACVLIHELLHHGGQARWLTAHAANGAGPGDLARLAGEMFGCPLAPGSKVES
jgi:carboxylate-amine ligase